MTALSLLQLEHFCIVVVTCSKLIAIEMFFVLLQISVKVSFDSEELIPPFECEGLFDCLLLFFLSRSACSPSLLASIIMMSLLCSGSLVPIKVR